MARARLLTEEEKEDIKYRHNILGEFKRQISRDTRHARQTINEVLNPTRIPTRRHKFSTYARKRYANDATYRREALDRGLAYARNNPEKRNAYHRRWRAKRRELGLPVT